jgi:CBS domain-containing protein
VSAADTTTLPELADLLARHHIKRVPILHDGKLVGIVSRADIIRTLAGDAQARAQAI